MQTCLMRKEECYWLAKLLVSDEHGLTAISLIFDSEEYDSEEMEN